VGLVETTVVGKALLFSTGGTDPNGNNDNGGYGGGGSGAGGFYGAGGEVDIMEVEAIIIYQIGALVLVVLDTVHL